MKRVILLFTLLAFSAILPSCASKKEAPSNPYTSTAAAPPKPFFLQSWMGKFGSLFPKKQKPPSAMPPQWVGVIRMVNSEENFVLVESGAMSAAIPGETYLAVGKGMETASLKMSALKNPPFLIADILSGSPATGDKIYLPKSSTPPPAPTPSPSPAPTARPTPKEKKADSVKKKDKRAGFLPGLFSKPSPSPAPEKEAEQGH